MASCDLCVARALALELVVEEKEELQQSLHDSDLRLERAKEELTQVAAERDDLQGKVIANDLVLKQVVAEKEELRKKLFARDLELERLISEKERLQQQVTRSLLQQKLIESDLKLRKAPAEEAQLRQFASGKVQLQQKSQDLDQLSFELTNCRDRCLREIFSVPEVTKTVVGYCGEKQQTSSRCRDPKDGNSQLERTPSLYTKVAKMLPVIPAQVHVTKLPELIEAIQAKRECLFDDRDLIIKDSAERETELGSSIEDGDGDTESLRDEFELPELPILDWEPDVAEDSELHGPKKETDPELDNQSLEARQEPDPEPKEAALEEDE